MSPLANTYETHPQLLITFVPTSPTHGERIPDASRTIYYVLNSGVTKPNLTKILHDVEALVSL